MKTELKDVKINNKLPNSVKKTLNTKWSRGKEELTTIVEGLDYAAYVDHEPNWHNKNDEGLIEEEVAHLNALIRLYELKHIDAYYHDGKHSVCPIEYEMVVSDETFAEVEVTFVDLFSKEKL